MTFKKPVPFFRALAELARKKLVPTWLGSAELRGLDAAVKRQALFSARMTQLRALQAVQDGVKAMLEGKGNLADAKLLLGDTLKGLGYEPEKGFPGDDPDQVPPATRGTLTDLASERRKTLILDTQYKMAANAAFVAAGQEEQRLYQWPCYELVRIGRRRTPRGYARRKGGLIPKPGTDWPARFVAAGGELYEKGMRMIAPKGSDVWIKLGEGAGGFTDTLGNPYPPFAFSSGYGLREVARGECLLLGVIQPEDKAAKMPVALATRLKAQAKGLDPKLLAAFKKDLVTREDGSVRLKRLMEAELKKADAAYRNRDQLAGVPTLLSNRVAMLNDLVNGKGRGIKRVDRSGGNPKIWKEEEWVRAGGRFASFKGPRRVDSLKDMMAKLKDHPELDLRAHVMMLDGRVGARMSKAFGRDVQGWELVLDSADYRHAIKTHAAEVAGQWVRLPGIVAGADHIIASKVKTDAGELAVEVWKKDGSWLQLVVVPGKDRKIKVKTFKRRQELFNRLFGKGGSWITSATSKDGGVLTSETTQELQDEGGMLAVKPASTRPGRSIILNTSLTPLQRRCKRLLGAMQRQPKPAARSGRAPLQAA